MAVHVNTSAINNITEYPNSFKRQGAFPLERYSLFNSLEQLQAYIDSNPIAYIGQIVTVAIPADPEHEVAASTKAYIIGADQLPHELAQGGSVTPAEGGASQEDVDTLKSKLATIAALVMPSKETYTTNDLYDILKSIVDACKTPEPTPDPDPEPDE